MLDLCILELHYSIICIGVAHHHPLQSLAMRVVTISSYFITKLRYQSSTTVQPFPIPCCHHIAACDVQDASVNQDYTRTVAVATGAAKTVAVACTLHVLLPVHPVARYPHIVADA